MKKKVLNHKIISWSLYDFANTAFSALFVSFFFPFFIKEFLGGNEFQIGLVMGLSMFFVAIIVPFLGTLADLTHKRVKLVGFFTVLCVIFTTLVAFSNLKYALLFGLLANFCYHACLVIYNSILPQLCNKKDMGHVSGFGVAIGYLGTFFSLIMAFGILSFLGWETFIGISAMFPATALFFLLFSLPLFLFVKDKPLANRRSISHYSLPSLVSLKKTIKKFPKYKGLIPFLLSSFAYSNAITATIIFIFLYARDQIQLSVFGFMLVYVVFAIAAALGSVAGGRLADKIGARNTLAISGIVWIFALLPLFSPRTIYTFFLVGVLGGASMGSIWAANRPMIISLAPKMKVGQFFGFDELADKFSGVLEPVIFGLLVVKFGYSYAIFSLIVFFAIGLWLLKYVPNKVYNKV